MNDQPDMFENNALLTRVEDWQFIYDTDEKTNQIQWINRDEQARLEKWEGSRVDLFHEYDGIHAMAHVPVEGTQLISLMVISVGEAEAFVRHSRAGFDKRQGVVPVPLLSVARQLREHIGQQVVGVTPDVHGVESLTILRLANPYELAIYARGDVR